MMTKILMPIVILLLILVIFFLAFNNNDENNMNEIINNGEQNREQSAEQSTQETDLGSAVILLETNLGKIEIELLPNEAPKTVENFLKLSKDGFYDGTKFHRVIKDFMIQGGDPLSKDDSQRMRWGTGGPGYTFEDEPNGVALVKGVVAMANAGPDTNGSQFFIITAEETPWLQGKHTGFGRIVNGLDIIMKIQEVEVAPGDQPVEDIILQKVTVK